MKKLIIFSAPSGSGKSTIINSLMTHKELGLRFSISCTSRPPRGTEKDGVEYFFISSDEFRKRVLAGDFLEYEEVYPGRFYGTLKSQVDKQLADGQNVVLDIDVKGAANVKKVYGERALSVFIQPPSLEELRRRLQKRGTDSDSVIEDRLHRAAFELTYASQADVVVINNDLDAAIEGTLHTVREFLLKK